MNFNLISSKCPSCKAKIEGDAAFCPDCGQMVKKVKNVKDFIGVQKKKVKKPPVKINKEFFKNGYRSLKRKVKEKLNPITLRINKIKAKLRPVTVFFGKVKAFLRPILSRLHFLYPVLRYAVKFRFVFIIAVFLLLTIGGNMLNNSLSEPKVKVSKEAAAFNEAEKPIPLSGVINAFYGEKAERVLKFRANERPEKLFYYIKIMDENSKEVKTTAFMKSGENMSLKMPIGFYNISYAVGSKWYGENHLFGPETYYGKVTEKVDATIDSRNLAGFEVQFFNQYGGNLRTDEIKQSEF